MKRSCEKIPVGQILSDIDTSSSVEIYIDSGNKNSIMKLLTCKNASDQAKMMKRFRRVIVQVLSGQYNKGIYLQEKLFKKLGSNDITAMKLTSSNNQNVRIYCREFFVGEKKVVMILGLLKKTQKIDKNLQNKIKTIVRYEYDFSK